MITTAGLRRRRTSSLLMKISTRIRRLAATTGLATALLAASGWFTPASAAPTYWTFKSSESRECITGSSTGRVWVAGCSGAGSQQWDWIGSDREWNKLKNRATGTCLTTDFRSYNNAVWLSSCSSSRPAGQLYSLSDGYLGAYDFSYRLRTSPSGSGAVYQSDIAYAGVADKYYKWAGSHT
jgi:hypothetical protein